MTPMNSDIFPQEAQPPGGRPPLLQRAELDAAMPDPYPPQARIILAAEFPVKSFLENLAIRADNSVLVSNMLQKELWYAPPVGGDLPVRPSCIHTYDQPTLAIVEVEPDVFYLATSNLYTTHESYLHRVDLRGWEPGRPVKTQAVLAMPPECLSLNGGCLAAPRVLLLADSFGGMIWRIDLAEDGGEPTASVWLKHPSMDSDPNGPDASQPGVNGLKFHQAQGRLYYTSTVKQLFMRIGVDPETHAALGEPQFVAGGRMADDFILDPNADVAYLTTHRQNTIDRVPLDPALNRDFERNSVASHPPQAFLVGPSAGAWGRAPGEDGRVAYVLTDGGTKSPPKDGPQTAKLLRVEFDPALDRLSG